jgi:hypothetical protein
MPSQTYLPLKEAVKKHNVGYCAYSTAISVADEAQKEGLEAETQRQNQVVIPSQLNE